MFTPWMGIFNDKLQLIVHSHYCRETRKGPRERVEAVALWLCVKVRLQHLHHWRRDQMTWLCLKQRLYGMRKRPLGLSMGQEVIGRFLPSSFSVSQLKAEIWPRSAPSCWQCILCPLSGRWQVLPDPSEIWFPIPPFLHQRCALCLSPIIRTTSPITVSSCALWGFSLSFTMSLIALQIPSGLRNSETFMILCSLQ